MKCIAEPYKIWGDYNSDITTNLMIVFEKCDPKLRECESDAVINEWMKFKYLLV